MDDHGIALRGCSGTRLARRNRRIEIFAAAAVTLAMTGLTGLGACSSNSVSPSFSGEGGTGASSGMDAGGGADAPSIPVDDDAGEVTIDSAAPPPCPGSSVPGGATSGACVAAAGCPSCAPWGFACAGWVSPEMQGASASSFCHATPTEEGEGGTLICCTQPACVVSTVGGACDASVQTRYECNGGAVPTGTCAWLGAAAPNDYCCQ
jgi:hypothetical protein